MDNLNVAVADEKKNVLELIGKLFKDNDSFELIGTAKNSEEAYKMINKSTGPDVLLVYVKQIQPLFVLPQFPLVCVIVTVVPYL